MERSEDPVSVCVRGRSVAKIPCASACPACPIKCPILFNRGSSPWSYRGRPADGTGVANKIFAAWRLVVKLTCIKAPRAAPQAPNAFRGVLLKPSLFGRSSPNTYFDYAFFYAVLSIVFFDFLIYGQAIFPKHHFPVITAGRYF